MKAFILLDLLITALKQMLDEWDPEVYEDVLGLTIGDVSAILRLLNGLTGILGQK